jgi:ribosomal protein L35
MKLKHVKQQRKESKSKKIVYVEKAYKGHLLRRKNKKRLRRLSEPAQIHTGDSRALH